MLPYGYGPMGSYSPYAYQPAYGGARLLNTTQLFITNLPYSATWQVRVFSRTFVYITGLSGQHLLTSDAVPHGIWKDARFGQISWSGMPDKIRPTSITSDFEAPRIMIGTATTVGEKQSTKTGGGKRRV